MRELRDASPRSLEAAVIRRSSHSSLAASLCSTRSRGRSTACAGVASSLSPCWPRDARRACRFAVRPALTLRRAGPGACHARRCSWLAVARGWQICLAGAPARRRAAAARPRPMPCRRGSRWRSPRRRARESDAAADVAGLAALPYKPAGGGMRPRQRHHVLEQSRRRPWQPRGQGPWGSGPGGAPSPNDIEDAIRRLQKNFSGLPGGGLGREGHRGDRAGGADPLARARHVLHGAAQRDRAQSGVRPLHRPRACRASTRTGRGRSARSSSCRCRTSRSPRSAIAATGAPTCPSESLMLTGDKNIVNVHFRVNWRIDAAHPEDFVFNVLNPRETVKSVAESIMREVVGQKTIDGILTSDRKAIEPDAQGANAEGARRLQGRRAGRAGAVAVRRRPRAGRVRLPRRDRRAAGPAARRQRGRHLRQPDQARGGRRRVAHHRRG